jgi:hypothetical protein
MSIGEYKDSRAVRGAENARGVIGEGRKSA